MKFSIGYQLPDEFDSISDIVRDYKNDISEVYFAWPGESSGRSVIGSGGDIADVTEVLKDELRSIKADGVGLVLLFNANCYGEKAVSKELSRRVNFIVDELYSQYGLDAITTTSPFIASEIKKSFPGLEIRASVNMRVGTIKAMEYLSDSYDGYYLQREFNRDFKRIDTLYNWCARNGKSLHLIANSGCLNYCSFQTYHDNLVAHEEEIRGNDNIVSSFPSPCWEYLSKRPSDIPAIILQGSWIRPEDIKNYEKYFSQVKLATRMHSNPRKVINAYVRGRFHGNVTDLTEPGYSSLIKGKIIDNMLFPEDWFKVTSRCSKNCDSCNYCSEVASKVTIDING